MPACAKRQIVGEARHEALGDVEARERPLSAQVIEILKSRNAAIGLDGASERIRRHRDELGVCVSHQDARAARKTALHLQLKRFVFGRSEHGRLHRDAIKLRIRPQELPVRDRGRLQIALVHDAKKRIRHLAVQLGTEREILIGQLIELKAAQREVRSLGARVRGVYVDAEGQLALQVEIPLLHVGVRVTGKQHRGPRAPQTLLKIRSAPGRLV